MPLTRRRPLALPLVALLLAGCGSAGTSSGTWTVISTLGPAASVAPASSSPAASAPSSAAPSASAALSGAPEDVGVAVVGGYRYHGSAIPGLRDQYVFADFSGDPNDDLGAPLGSLLVATPSDDDGATWDWRRLVVANGPLGRFVTGMAEDPDGELYLMTRTRLGPAGATGEVLKLVPPG